MLTSLAAVLAGMREGGHFPAGQLLLVTDNDAAMHLQSIREGDGQVLGRGWLPQPRSTAVLKSCLTD
jgi:hypothetical protein